MKKLTVVAIVVPVMALRMIQDAPAAFIVECRSDGRGFANFSAPGATPAASTKSTAPGCIAANSIFGAPHTYIWKYTPGVDVDNYSPSVGTALGKYWDPVSGQAGITNVVATGTAGGGRGKYRVYGCWPTSGNVVALGTTITIHSDDGNFIGTTTNIVLPSINQNNNAAAPGPVPASTGNQWWLMAEVFLNTNQTYYVTSSAPANFVSQRFHAVMWERVPDTVNPCLSTPSVGGVAGPVFSGGTNVTVTGVSGTATAVTVYQGDGTNMTAIGTLNSGVVAGNNVVTVSPLIKGKVLSATQTVLGQESCVPNSGPIVGGGANPRIRVSASIRQPGGLSGPIGANGGGPAATIYWIKATGSVSGGAPVGGQILQPSTCWQTVVFYPNDSKFVWNSGTVTLPDPNQFGILEGLSFAMDDLTDTGPYQIYIDNLRNGSTVIQDFENQSTGTVIQFAKPGNSGTTSANLLSAPDSSSVSTNNAAAGTNSALVTWQFNGLGSGKWLRLNALAAGTPNPEVDLTLPIAVDVLILPAGVTNGHSLGLIDLLDDRTNCPGDNVSWTVTALPNPDTGPYTYQWQFNGVNIAGATTSTFTTNSVTAASSGKYSVLIGDGSGCLVTNIATLTALPVADIFSQPLDSVVNVGDPASFSVGASPVSPCSTPISYQWRHNGVNIANATGATLNIGSAQVSDAGIYSVAITNSFGSVISTNVTLNVIDVANQVIGSGTGLLGLYYSNHLSTAPFIGTPSWTNIDQQIAFAWLTGAPDDAINFPSLVNTDHFTVRWVGQIQGEWNQTYNLYTTNDDGIRLWVNNQLVINSWVNQGGTAEHVGTVPLTTNLQSILVEFFENTGNADVALSWDSPSQVKQVIAMSQLYPAAGPPAPPQFTATLNNRTNLVFNWGPGTYTIAWATNVLGPYTNKINAVISPYTVTIGSEPQRFFRLQVQ